MWLGPTYAQNNQQNFKECNRVELVSSHTSFFQQLGMTSIMMVSILQRPVTGITPVLGQVAMDTKWNTGHST